MEELTALAKLREQVKKNTEFRGRLLAVDPGETTGITIIDVSAISTSLVLQEQVPTWPLEVAVKNFSRILSASLPNFLVYESYHVYSWRLNEHKFSEVPTIQIIGCLKTLAIQQGIKYGHQTAQTGKAFFTDHRLKSFNMFYTGQPHARDSLRHACQYLTFGLKDS